MKFLCPSCKAKYQIADEKIGGRTLKMDCRRCGHAIVIKGDAPEAADVVDDAPPEAPAPSAHASRAPARPATRSQTAIPPQGTGNAHQSTAGNVRRPAGASRSGSSAGPFPQQRPGARSALGAEFRRTATSAPVEPPRATPLDQWHVAINDVPVGPMRRDEVARKIAIGAITPESLAWREGFDDWRPVKDIQELSVLLRRGGEGGTPSQRPGAPAPARAGASATGQQKPLPGARPPPARGGPPRPGDRAAARSNVVPIGGRLGAAAAPTIDAEDELDAEPTQIASAHEIEAARHRKSAPPSAAPRPRSAPSAPEVEDELDLPIAPVAAHAPLPAMTPTPVPFAAPPVSSMPVAPVAPAQRERRGLPVGAWIAIVGAGSFGAVLALAIAYRVIFPPGAVEPAAAVASVQPTPPPTTTPPVPEAPVAVDPPATDTTAAQPEAQPEQQAAAETTSAGSTTTPRTGSGSRTGSHTTATTTASTTTGAGAGSATKTTGGGGVFDQYADESGGMARIAGSGTRTGEDRAGARSELTAEQISSVVTRERRGLQDCWERAIRGARDVQAVRLDVSLTIGTSGIVTRAQARGNIPSTVQGDLQGCIETRVRRWHFPPSSGETETNFPLVFTGT